jgi:hypothetical protein
MRSARLLVLAMALILALGCGERRQIGTVSGRITLDGEPLADARVNFQPTGNERNPGIGSFGRTNGNGEYFLTLIDEKGKGAIVGTHRVMIKAVAEGKADDDKTPAGKDRVPPEFNINSTLTFEVKAGHNTADWKLETKKKK